MFTKLIDWRRSRRDEAGDQHVLPRHHFQAALNRERLRCDRSGSSMSLLVITVQGQPGTLREAKEALAELVRGRARLTDTAGWMAARKLGVILPDTPADGGWKLADDLRTLLHEQGLRARFEVFEYPFDESAQPELREAPSDEQDADRAAQPLQALFVRRLPVAKRALDLTAATFGLIAVSPVMLLAAIAIKLTSPGPIFYAQQRDGVGGRKFRIYKFRTMVVNADSIKDQLRAQSEQDGPAFKLKNDPRVTPIGRVLRRTCIDELPQLLNVIRGEMTIVGPRPMCSKEASQCQQWERRRLDVTPGLTCIWQVYGGSKVTFTEWMRMDLRYIRSRSLWNDLRLIFLTVPSVLRRDGVY